MLVVEDNTVNQKLALLQLNKLGYRAHAVGNGKEALLELERNQYALVLMDCQMPEMDGFEATRAIRRQEAGTKKHQIIVAMTAQAMAKDKEQCLAAGMDAYISKPVTIDMLEEVIAGFVCPDEDVVVAALAEEIHTGSLERAQDQYAGGYAAMVDQLGAESAAELFEQFVISLFELVDKGRLALAELRPAALKAVAHELKGTCASFFAEDLSALSERLDRYLAHKKEAEIDFEQCQAMFANLERAAVNYKAAYEQSRALQI